MATGRPLERGHKSDSYISAIEGNPFPVTLPKPTHAQREQLVPADVSQSKTVGLSEAELEPYRTNPKWACLRRCLFLAILLTWLFLFALAIFWIVRTPGCAAVKHKWWQGAVIYQLWTPAFQDSDADGLGDLAGVRSRLSQLRQIGVSAVFPRPFIATEDSGIGALDFNDVREDFGGLGAAKTFIESAHSQGLKVIVDVPLVATSDQHEWFQRSARASLPENGEFASYYYWKRNLEPSPFVNRYRNSSVLYFHVENRPDLPILNWRSENVSKAVKSALSFWIDQGADGFHLGSVELLARTADAKNTDWPEVVRILRGIRDHVNIYKNESVVANGKEIFLLASPDPIKDVHKRLLQNEAGLDAIVNTEMDRIAHSNKICYEGEHSVAGCANEIISDLLSSQTGREIMPVWELGNIFTSRLTTRVKSRLHAELLTMIQMLLPGSAMVYYGEEIGMRDVELAPVPQQSIMQWDATETAGFSSAIAKSPLNSDNVNINVNRQAADSKSPLQTFKRLARLREGANVLITGETYISKIVNNAFSLCRFEQTENATCGKVYVVAVNFGKRDIVHSLADLPPFYEHKNIASGKVIAVNSNSRNYDLGDSIDLTEKQIALGPEEGVVFSFKV